MEHREAHVVIVGIVIRRLQHHSHNLFEMNEGVNEVALAMKTMGLNSV